ncbi:thioesterase family protein [Solimonas marina]|uniref:Thioesterase n=1 Tax=Solimonas marina TaxID=2714601 RepID=A0A969W9Q7_9GAMM|nr:thioesterase family protein [Solimonas marina]NKF21511.1 thioesterase [Solimonas marina]
MMMLFRSLWIWLTFRLRGPLEVLGASRLSLRVWPGDIDMNLHMNNGRYFSVADLGRLDLGLRNRVWLRALKRGWRPVAGDSDARFSSSLQPFQRYQLQSRTLGWDAKWIYCEHRFVRNGRVCALVLVRYLFISPEGVLPPSKVMALGAGDVQTPTLPDWAVRWGDTQDRITATLKAERAARD